MAIEKVKEYFKQYGIEAEYKRYSQFIVWIDV